MTTNAEQDEALAAMKLADNLNVLDRVATRNNVDSQTASNQAYATLLLSKATLRTTLRRCAVFVCVLSAAWSVVLWVRPGL